MSRFRPFRLLAMAALVGLGLTAQARAEQLGTLVQLSSVPKFTFADLGSAGGTITGTLIAPSLFIDQTTTEAYISSLDLALTYAGDNTYTGTFTVSALFNSGTVQAGDTLLGATITAQLTGNSGSLSLLGASIADISSVLFPVAASEQLVSSFLFTNLTGAFDFSGPVITGSGTANGLGTFATIPEPASVLMFSLGLAAPIGLAASARRRPVA